MGDEPTTAESAATVLVRQYSDESVAAVGRQAAQRARAHCATLPSLADQLAAEKRAIVALILDGGERLASAGVYDAGAVYAHEVLSFALIEAARAYPWLVGVTLQATPRAEMPAGIGAGKPLTAMARRWPWWRRAWRRMTGR